MIQTPKLLSKKMPYYAVLDGWRGISIICILAAHLLPLGLKSWQLNATFGVLGMSLFFTLSGFLITSTLIYYPNVPNFLIRRLCRIIPLAWLFLLVTLPMVNASLETCIAHFLFYANLPPFWLTELTAHFWSLCVEVQFYLGIAILFAITGKRGLLLLPVIAIAVTLGRIWHQQPVTIVTYYRVDEILAGACLALIVEQKFGQQIPRFLSWINPFFLIVLLMIASHPVLINANYLRPYLAAVLVGSTLFQKSKINDFLQTKLLADVASISYALYLIHPLFAHGWFSSGGTFIKYAKRPLTFLLTFGFAYLSTFYFEKPWINLGKRWIKQRQRASF